MCAQKKRARLLRSEVPGKLSRVFRSRFRGNKEVFWRYQFGPSRLNRSLSGSIIYHVNDIWTSKNHQSLKKQKLSVVQFIKWIISDLLKAEPVPTASTQKLKKPLHQKKKLQVITHIHDWKVLNKADETPHEPIGPMLMVVVVPQRTHCVLSSSNPGKWPWQFLANTSIPSIPRSWSTLGPARTRERAKESVVNICYYNIVSWPGFCWADAAFAHPSIYIHNPVPRWFVRTKTGHTDPAVYAHSGIRVSCWQCTRELTCRSPPPSTHRIKLDYYSRRSSPALIQFQ